MSESNKANVFSLAGVIPPLLTPLSKGRLDVVGVERLVEYVLCADVSGLFVLGTTGEGPALSHQTRRAMVEESIAVVENRTPVIVGVSDASLEEAGRSAEHAAQAGAHAIAATPPFYFSLDQSSLGHWYQQLAERSPLPLLLYNFPGLAKTVIELETVKRLMDCESIVGIKDSSGEMAGFGQLCELSRRRDDWHVFIGPEERLAEAVAMGADGGVCGGANYQPQLFVDFYKAAIDENHQEIQRLRVEVDSLARDVYGLPVQCESVVRGLKRRLSKLGICSTESTWDITSTSVNSQI